MLGGGNAVIIASFGYIKKDRNDQPSPTSNAHVLGLFHFVDERVWMWDTNGFYLSASATLLRSLGGWDQTFPWLAGWLQSHPHHECLVIQR